MTVVLAIVIGATVGATSKKSHQVTVSHASPRLPPPEVETNVLVENKDEIGATLIQRYNAKGMDFSALYLIDSPAERALNFVSGGIRYANLDQDQRVQRFAISTLYYATYGMPHAFLDEGPAPGWKSANFWITDADECTWEGITCENGVITEINLSDHLLTGYVPQELGLLEDLVSLDLSTNLIEGSGLTNNVWMFATSLQELILDDNFIVGTTGIPVQMGELVNLEKLSMSYNLLQGTMDGTIFNGLRQLTHLELESNYLEGPMPIEIATLPNLVYLYVRRNSLQFPLANIIQEGMFPSIFALWLDNNDISGTIPTAIGTFSDLASFSVTNATLTGALPTELGQLPGMKRLWLYGNKLTGPIPVQFGSWTGLQVLELQNNDLQGTMPQPVCQAVAQSDYAFATLSADCAEVSCDNCCTQCF